MGIGRQKSGGALRIGGAVHKGWELFRKGTPAELALAQSIVGYEIIPEWADPYDWSMEQATVYGLLRAYFDHYSGDQLEFVEVERGFALPLVNPDTKAKSRTFERAGKIDGIVKWDGRLMLLEGKTTSDPIDPASDYWLRLRVDPQPSMYVLAARDLGYDVQAVIYDVIHKPAMRPAAIALVEDGAKIVLNSAGERVRTKDGKKWRETGDAALGYVLQTRPETPDEFGARIYEDCKARPDFYFARREIPRLEDDLNEFREELWQVAQLLQQCKSRGLWFRNCGKATCTGCEYADICLHGIKVDPAALPPGYQKLDSLHPELEETTTI